MGIRYSKNGDIETYDEKTGKTIGHISTMGIFCVSDEEPLKQRKWIKELAEKKRNKYDNKRVYKKKY